MASEIEVNWRIGKSLHQRLQYILEGQIFTDVTFIVGAKGNQKRMRANRFMLSCGSQVFEAMFQEASKDQVRMVEDVDPDTFMEILKFVYYEQATITGYNALYILKAAKKFVLPQLVEKCFSLLKESMDLKNVCGILNSSLVLDEHDVTDSCMTFIRNTPEAVLISDPFTSLSDAALMRVVEDGSMACASELQVYQACMRWAEAECGRHGLPVTDGNKRDVLGAVLYQIRFYQLNSTEFSHLMRNSVLLNAEEKLEIYDMIAERDHDVIHRGSYRFNTTARRVINTTARRGPNPAQSQLIMARFRDVVGGRKGEKTWVSNGASNAINFSSSKPLLVTGAGLYGGVEAGTHAVHMQLLDDKDGVLADTGYITMASNGSYTPIPVLFSSPCQVDANRTYCIKATITGHLTHFGIHGMVTVTSDKCTLSFSNSSCSIRTDVDQGQIPTIVVSLL